jgi:hypothetical protein
MRQLLDSTTAKFSHAPWVLELAEVREIKKGSLRADGIVGFLWLKCLIRSKG